MTQPAAPVRARRSRHTAAPVPVVPPGPSTIDLHTHTNRSDGTESAADLVRAAAAAGVRLLAITDHDTLAGYREVASRLPAALELLPGVEINAIVRDRPELRESEVHIVGLGVDPADAALEATLERQRLGRRRRFATMIERLRAAGIEIAPALGGLVPDEIDSLGRPTIARALIAVGLAGTVEEAFERYLSPGRPGYVPRDGLDPLGAIGAVRDAGGLAVLAHFGEAAERLAVVRGLVDCGLGGLEVYYRTFDAATVRRVGAVARELRLVATGGSDYHGDGRSYADVHAGLWVPAEVGTAVKAALDRPTGSAEPG